MAANVITREELLDEAYRIADALKTSVGFVWSRAGGGKTKTKSFLSYLSSSGKAIPSGNGISTLE